jgi:predicted adenine nucleotide alpha hydrolase (AANH) superfamily ATPase
MTEHATKDYECDLLLHTCCGPCLEWPARLLLQEKQNLLIYYINPNIQPAVENKRRLENLKILTHKLGLELIADPICQPEIWKNWDDSVEARCRMCYRRRLQATADKAVELGIPAFSTTLLVSPWQDRDAIVEIGNRIARPAGLLFVDRDFRSGYREGQRLAKEDGLYRQKYCGCLPSLELSDFKEQIKSDQAALAE